MQDTTYNPFTTIQTQIDKISDLLGLDAPTKELLRWPMREFSFSIPVRMSNNKMEIFRGFRIQYNDALGPAKGGIRFHPLETLDSVRALASAMTWKTAAVNLPLGGGKGGVICDPHNLTKQEMEGICRGWVRQMVRHLGPNLDVPAPDIMSNSQHMLWMLDEFETITGGRFPGTFTGKPLGMGGSLGRKEATGYGLVYTIREALILLNKELKDTIASVQGFGAVGQAAIDLYTQLGGTVRAVATWNQQDQASYTYINKTGINLEELRKISNEFGDIDRAQAQDLGYQVVDGNQWLSQEVDILIPAALEHQLTEKTVQSIHPRVSLIAEGANGPTTHEADQILKEKAITLIPDILGNAGGVTTSYFEQVQSNMNYYWSKEDVFEKLDSSMTKAFHQIADFVTRKNLTFRDAAYVVAIDRVARACKDRGWC